VSHRETSFINVRSLKTVSRSAWEKMKLSRIVLILLFITGAALAADLTGNWVAKEDRKDGTYRTTYFDLKQDGDKITGHIRGTQFYYTISSSTGTPDN